MVTLKHYQYFVVVAEEQHFGRAADRLHMTLPPLSLQIRQLEEHIGVELFVRGKRPIQLTAAGRELYPYAQAVLQQSEIAINRTRQSASGELGSLTLGVTAAALLGPLPVMLRQFRKTYPNVKLNFREMVTSLQVQALESRLINVGVMRPTILPETICSRVFLSEPLVFALPKGHPLADYARIPPHTIYQQPFVNYDRINSRYFNQLVRDFLLQHALKINVVLEADQLNTVIALVGSGAGIALVPKVGNHIHLQGVEFRPLELNDPPRSELIVCHHHEENSPAVVNLLQAMTQQSIN